MTEGSIGLLAVGHFPTWFNVLMALAFAALFGYGIGSRVDELSRGRSVWMPRCPHCGRQARRVRLEARVSDDGQPPACPRCGMRPEHGVWQDAPRSPQGEKPATPTIAAFRAARARVRGVWIAPGAPKPPPARPAEGYLYENRPEQGAVAPPPSLWDRELDG